MRPCCAVHGPNYDPEPMWRMTAGLLIVGALAGCSSSSPKATTHHATIATGTTAAPLPTVPAPALVGNPIVLNNYRGKPSTRIEVKIVDPGTPKDDSSTPYEGDRIVAVHFRFTRIAPTPVHTPSIRDAMTLVDTQGQSYGPAFGPEAEGCPPVPGDTVDLLGAGDVALGCFNFSVPNGRTLAKVKFQNGESETLVWLVP